VKLYRWQGAARNFGDELNTLLWPRLLPGFFDDDPAELFLGIGSVLDSRHPLPAVKLVAGAGYGGYQPPAALDANWVVHWTRGPRTARRLGLPAACGIGDPAMLIPLTGGTRAAEGQSVGFMPHFETATRGDWAAATEAAGIDLIDPRGDPDTIIAAIGRCRLLISEALHGTIVADALRVP
jgi:succinoglycan biosynthesis protein ExoV